MSVSVRSLCEGGADGMALWAAGGEAIRPVLATQPLLSFSGVSTWAAAGVPASAIHAVLLATIILGSAGLLCAFLRFPTRPANASGSSDHRRFFQRLLADSRQAM